MKFVVMRSNLREAISLLERASGDVSNFPILKNVLIKAEKGVIVLVATNLEIAVTVNVSGKIIEDGTITAPLSLFASIINNLQSDRLNIESKGALIEVKTDNYTATLQGLSAEDFPVTPKIEDMESWIEVKGAILKESLQQVLGAAMISELRPELSSVLFDFSIESLKLTATDGFRLAEKNISGNYIHINNTESFKVLVPLKTAQELSRSINNEEEVRLYHDVNQILFKTAHSELISRLIDGNFPEYSQLIPKKFSTEVVINREELLNAIKVANVFSQKNGEITILVHDDKKTIDIHSADQALGENNFILSAKIKGEPVEVVFNSRSFGDAIKVITTEDVFLGFSEETNPALIKSTTDISYFYILRPLLKGQ